MWGLGDVCLDFCEVIVEDLLFEAFGSIDVVSQFEFDSFDVLGSAGAMVL